MHRDCRDLTGVCYGCRWRQARAGGIAGDMLPPQAAGPAPFAANLPATVAQGLALPTVASPENREGRSDNEVLVLTAAVFAGWRIEKREEYGTILLKKRGRGYLRLTFSIFGRILHAATQRQYLDPTAARITAYLEER